MCVVVYVNSQRERERKREREGVREGGREGGRFVCLLVA